MKIVAHALVRAASRLVSTRCLAQTLSYKSRRQGARFFGLSAERGPWRRVETSLDAARTSACATDCYGGISLQLLVLMVPVFFGFMGFAIDLGRLYLIRGELNQAANAMALAAASQLIGTTAATDYATNQAMLTLDNTNLNANKYNFGSLLIGDSSGFYQSTVPSPAYFDTATNATTTDGVASGGNADGTTAQYVQANITADAPLIWWALLTLGQSRKTSVAARAVAGISAPLCTACNIENFAIAALSTDDTTNFGYTIGTAYTFGYSCTGTPPPTPLAGTAQRIPYLLLDRYNTSSPFDETQQLFRVGAGGLMSSTTLAQACFTVNNTEVVWATAAPVACTGRLSSSVGNMLCGLTTRMQSDTLSIFSGCQTAITDVSDLIQAYPPDTDLTAISDYTTYVGDKRRVITVPIVDALSGTGSMTVMGFRQFLVQATTGDEGNDPTDTNGRFIALYIGNPVPLKQGRFDGGCDLSSGPGKVVLFQ